MLPDYLLKFKKENLNNKRLDWDEYFMSIAVLASCRSPCE